MSEWKDISTAPKDGTKILIWDFEREMAYVARWVKSYRGDKWLSVSCIDDYFGSNAECVSHWMPLPKPPKDPKQP